MPSTNTPAVEEDVQKDNLQIHIRTLLYVVMFLGVVLLLTLGGALFLLAPSKTAQHVSKDQFEVVRDVATFFIGIFTLSVTFSAAVVTVHLARNAMRIAQASLQIAKNSAQLAEREFNLEAQRHANEMVLEMRQAQRLVDTAVQQHASASLQIVRIPIHWTALLLWRLNTLERGDVWGGPPCLSDKEYRDTLLASMSRTPHSRLISEEEVEPLRQRLERFEAQLQQQGQDTHFELINAIDYLGETALWEQCRGSVCHSLQSWLAALEAIETQPRTFTLYENHTKSSQAIQWMKQHCTQLLTIFDSNSPSVQSDAIEVLLRAMVLTRSGYLPTLAETDLATRLKLLPMLCLLAQIPGQLPAYSRRPDVGHATRSIYHTLKPLTSTRQAIYESSQLLASTSAQVSNPDGMFAQAPEGITHTLQRLHEMWQELPHAHQQAPEVFASPPESDNDYAVIEPVLASWKLLAESTLNPA